MRGIAREALKSYDDFGSLVAEMSDCGHFEIDSPRKHGEHGEDFFIEPMRWIDSEIASLGPTRESHRGSVATSTEML